MKSWKTWGCVLALLVASALACFGDTSVEHNLDEAPTDGGAFKKSSCEDVPTGELFCHQDGDYQMWECNEGTSMPDVVPCLFDEYDRQTFCYGARDTEPASCVSEYDIVTGEHGLEPGSDLWHFRKKEQWEPEPDNSGGSSCCKVCRSGKACGDSCIDSSKSCNVGRGCACNG